MTNKEYKDAIEYLSEEWLPQLAEESMCQCKICKELRENDPYAIVIFLASRMAMYEWWWDIMVDEAERCGIADIPCFVYPLDSEQFERVMKAWKENT